MIDASLKTKSWIFLLQPNDHKQEYQLFLTLWKSIIPLCFETSIPPIPSRFQTLNRQIGLELLNL